MNDRDDILIDRYLAHEATSEEVREVEARRLTDLDFARKLADAEQAILAIRLQQRSVLRERLSQRNISRQSPYEEPRQIHRRLPWILLAAGLITGILIWLLIPDARNTLSPEQTTIPDSSTQTSKHEPPDTVLQKNTDDQLKRESESQRDHEMAEVNQKGEQLFAMYFTPYTDDLMNPSVRGHETLSRLDSFQLLYLDGRFMDAVRLFQRLPRSPKPTDNTMFMYANALMATGNVRRALPVLESILKNNRSRYVTESIYALALGHCRNGDLENGLRYIEQYLLDDNAARKEAAMKIMLDLK